MSSYFYSTGVWLQSAAASGSLQNGFQCLALTQSRQLSLLQRVQAEAHAGLCQWSEQEGRRKYQDHGQKRLGKVEPGNDDSTAAQ